MSIDVVMGYFIDDFKHTSQINLQFRFLTLNMSLPARLADGVVSFELISCRWILPIPPEKIKKKQRFFDVFRGYRKRTGAWNGVIRKIFAINLAYILPFHHGILTHPSPPTIVSKLKLRPMIYCLCQGPVHFSRNRVGFNIQLLLFTVILI